MNLKGSLFIFFALSWYCDMCAAAVAVAAVAHLFMYKYMRFVYMQCAKQDRENATAKEMEAIEIHRVVCSCVHAYSQFESKPNIYKRQEVSLVRKSKIEGKKAAAAAEME